ncbi:DNA replication terminus site-binding protein [Mangrovibacter phragmitis]|uniref:DNA replication terminus site-binding protein n=1 Tax=Mangrovibacter phragmitis TaxID=1691903 RepID=UPI00336A1129
MAHQDCTQALKKTFSHIEHQTARLTGILAECRLLAARTFALPERLKGTEQDDIDEISVTALVGHAARTRALHHFRHFFIQQQSAKQSSKAAVRLPGALCVAVNHHQHSELNSLIDDINQHKQVLKTLITQTVNLPPTARFEWVHQHLPGLITLNAWRQIIRPENPSSINFGWANKQIIKNLTRDEVLAMLEKSLKAKRAVPPWTQEQWYAHVSREYQDVASLPERVRLKIRRPVKVQPIARVWYAGQRRQQQLACSSPLVVLCQEHTAVPDIGELLNYEAASITWRHKPSAQQGRLLIPRLHLWLMDDGC